MNTLLQHTQINYKSSPRVCTQGSTKGRAILAPLWKPHRIRYLWSKLQNLRLINPVSLLEQDKQTPKHLTWRDFLQDQIEIPIMAWALQIPKGLRVLEVGCGTGNAFAALERELQPAELTGIDINLSHIQQARQRCKSQNLNCQVVHADLGELPFNDNSFDVVIDFGTTHHVKNQAKAFLEIERVLSPAGYWIHESLYAQFLAHPIFSLKKIFKNKIQPSLSLSQSKALWKMRQK